MLICYDPVAQELLLDFEDGSREIALPCPGPLRIKSHGHRGCAILEPSAEEVALTWWPVTVAPVAFIVAPAAHESASIRIVLAGLLATEP